MRNTPNACTMATDGQCGFRGKQSYTSHHNDTDAVGDGCGLKCVFRHANLRVGLSVVSPDGGFEFEEFLRGLDDPGVVAGEDAGAQEEAYVPVALQLVQAAFLPQQAAQLHSYKTRKSI